MAKSKRDLINQLRKETSDYDILHKAYAEIEKGGDTLKMTLSAHYDKLAEQAAKYAAALDTSTN